ncbi:MAG: divergent PAP2 family protein [Spirochaetaceae bacterium]
MSTLPISLSVAVLVQLSCQTFKVLLYSVRERRLALDYFVSAGGFPSSHSAFVTALTTSVALSSGVESDITAVSAVLSIIVIYDSLRLRGQVERQAEFLNRIRSEGYPEIEPFSERVGHTLPEVMAGILFGLLAALLIAGALLQ